MGVRLICPRGRGTTESTGLIRLGVLLGDSRGSQPSLLEVRGNSIARLI